MFVQWDTVAQIREDNRNENDDKHYNQTVDIPQLSVVTVPLGSSVAAGGVLLLVPEPGMVVSLGSHTL